MIRKFQVPVSKFQVLSIQHLITHHASRITCRASSDRQPFSAAMAFPLVCLLAAANNVSAQEVSLPSDAFKKLDTFEAHVLNKADKSFNGKSYRLATKEYDSFILDYPKSKAVPYALLRKARSTHLDNKRFEAIKQYQEVLDYFPDDVRYAAAALYYTGLCHQQNGDIDKALKAWAEMAEDVDYRKHFLAAPAMKALADNLMKQQKIDSAIKYYKMVALTFRTGDWRYVISPAISNVNYHHIRRKPDEAKFKEFYVKAQGVEHRPQSVPTDPSNDWHYWKTLRSLTSSYGSFKDSERGANDSYWKYWTSQMSGKFLDSDEFQLALAGYINRYERSTKNWYQRVDQVFASKASKEDFNARVASWISIYRGHPEKIKEYFKKIQWDKMGTRQNFNLIVTLSRCSAHELSKDIYPRFKFAEMTNGEKIELLKLLYDYIREGAMAKNFFNQIRLGEMTDPAKSGLANYLWHKDEMLVFQCYAAMRNQEYADYCRLQYFHFRKDPKRGIVSAKKVVSVPDYAKDAWTKLADFYEMTKEWKNAINALRLADSPPGTLFRIARNYERLSSISQAVAQLKEIENFFRNQRASAAMEIAYVYSRAKKKKEEIAALRHIMKKYPGSGHSNTAHERLEALGVRIGGGVDAN